MQENSESYEKYIKILESFPVEVKRFIFYENLKKHVIKLKKMN